MTVKILQNPEHNGLEVYTHSKPGADIIQALKDAFFRWHNKKKCWFARDSERNRKLLSELFSTEFSLAAPPIATIKTITNKFGVKAGDIFNASWGYDQTNEDFFQVVALVGTAFVRIKEIATKQTRTESSMSGYVVPLKDCFTDRGIFIKDNINGDLKKVQASGSGSYYIKVGNYYARPTDEKTEHFVSSWA